MKQVNGQKLLESLGSGVSAVRGRITPDAPMDRVTWFRAGGLADAPGPADHRDPNALVRDQLVDVEKVGAGRADPISGLRGHGLGLGRPSSAGTGSAGRG